MFATKKTLFSTKFINLVPKNDEFLPEKCQFFASSESSERQVIVSRGCVVDDCK